MSAERKAKLFQNGGSQAVRLPADYRFEGDEVYISRDEVTGDIVLSAQSRRRMGKDFIEFRDSLEIAWEDVDDYMAERPMNQPATWRNVFEED